MGTYRVTYEIDFNDNIGTNVRFIDAVDEQDAEDYFIKNYQSKKASIGKVLSVELLDNDTQH
jgi:hypothetical protein